MNRFKELTQKYGAKVAGVVGALSVSMVALAAHATTADDLADIASTVGTSFQTNAVAMLQAILPYVVTITVVFLGAKLALRWIKRSAH